MPPPPYARRILHYSPGSTDFQSEIADRAIAGCWFELQRQGGCGAGELRLRDEFTQRNAIEIGDWIACEFAEDDRWYLGRVEKRVARSPAVVTFRLAGMAVELGEVFPGGFGSAVADGVPPHRCARTDLFSFDPDRADETVDFVDRADDFVKLLVQQYVTPRTHILYDANLIDAAPQDSVTSLKFRGEETARSIIREQALRATNASWGVGADGTFFFLQPKTTLLATYREGTDLLSLEEARDLELVFNRVLLTGDYVYAAPDSSGGFGGFYRWRGTYIQPESRDAYGERRIRLTIPWIRSSDDSRAFVAEFFRAYAQPSSRYRAEAGNQTVLPRPWEGTIRLEDRDGTELVTAPVETIRVDFDHAPRFTLEIGPADPRTLWPASQQDERWELSKVGHGELISDDSSSSSGIVVGCCPSGLPETLTATFSGDGACECFGLNSLTLTYNLATFRWEGTLLLDSCGPINLQILFWCPNEGSNCQNFLCAFIDQNNPQACHVEGAPADCGCSPLNVVFQLSDEDCCAGTWTITITE